MPDIVDRVFREVCLDERVSDGIFRMDNEQHMNALRDYFIKKGITQEAAVHVTNRMVEGNYPDRQAYRKEDGILVTWPSPQHKQKAMQKDPNKYTEKDPNPEMHQEEPKEPIKQRPPKKDDKEVEKDDKEDDSLPKSGGGSIFKGGDSGGKDVEGGKELAVEPPRDEKTAPIPVQPHSPTVPPVPRTPERIAAEKEVVNQILATDDNALTNVANPLSVKETALNHQLNELYKQADQWGFREAITFLTPYVKP